MTERASRDDLPRASVLLIEDDEALRLTLAELLERRGYAPVLAETGTEGLAKVEARIASVLLDLRLPDMDGMKVLERLQKEDPRLPVIVVTGHGSERRAVQAVKEGAFNYIPKPIEAEELLGVLREAVERRRLDWEIQHLKAQLDEKFGVRGLLGSSPAMRKVFEKISQVAGVRSTVLITGESGTGKELVARAIHQLSERRNRPFVAVNCAALPEPLVEDELFGHVRGAYTGADSNRDGRFKQAHRGTLLVDEIGEMAPRTQAKLLRVLETMEFSPVGSTAMEKVDVRVLAATNRPLREEVEAGRFREDLFYRINVVRIDLPALRERPGDISILSRAFLDEISAANGRSVKSMTPEALRILEQYPWPGNVRELRNTLEQIIVLSDREVIDVEDLPPEIRPAVRPDEEGMMIRPGTSLRAAEKALILRTMDEFGGNRARVAGVLGISLRTLQRKLKDYGLTRSE
ncbi:MAG: sigma-54-dependent Fis family transcriptional regulator [Planctomycetes bacterium]|nr:sigma-54-dependent Fis family transcriptional regulator [Planctomycetota bacterium]